MKKALIFIFFCLKTTMYTSAQNNTISTLSTFVKTQNGTLEGAIEKSGVRSFKGIPFAAPPVGDLRWKEPRPVKNWNGIRKAKQFSAHGMQYNVFDDMNFRSKKGSEDCLYLNVWVPPGKNKNLPVLVYFYGGGFVAGDGSEPRYDGESMAAKGIVALTVNYRLGVFGFMAHPELTKESPHNASGNYGLLDQSAALHWVKNNIAAFGGDPQKITIAGESAGSVSVSVQMASPLSRNLVARAIGKSGSVLGTLSAVPLKTAEQTGVEFSRSLALNSLAELRALPADSLLEASRRFGVFRFQIAIDGYLLPKNPYQIYEAGEQAKVPLLAGWNSEEMNSQAILGNEKPTKENYIKAVKKLYGDSAGEAIKNYNPLTDNDVEQAATDLASDRFIGYSTWKWIHLQNKTGQPVYRYFYLKPRPLMNAAIGSVTPGLAGGITKNVDSAGKKLPPASRGAVHSAEIEYAMGNLATNKVYAWTEDDYKVSKTMQEYFANFTKKGDPNSAGLPVWPMITSNETPVMYIDVDSRVEPAKHTERYLFLDRFEKNNAK
jgi:para-nitrobenzyl esterase